jgi:hypothetical protein
MDISVSKLTKIKKISSKNDFYIADIYFNISPIDVIFTSNCRWRLDEEFEAKIS